MWSASLVLAAATATRTSGSRPAAPGVRRGAICRGVLALSLAAAAACANSDAERLLGVRRGSVGVGTGAGGGGVVTPPPGVPGSLLVGRWTRIIYFNDGLGNVASSRTTWEFRADGSAQRVVTTCNLTLGLCDSVVDVGRWRVEGTTTLVYSPSSPPGQPEVRYDFRFEGQTLILGGVQFLPASS